MKGIRFHIPLFPPVKDGPTLDRIQAALITAQPVCRLRLWSKRRARSVVVVGGVSRRGGQLHCPRSWVAERPPLPQPSWTVGCGCREKGVVMAGWWSWRWSRWGEELHCPRRWLPVLETRPRHINGKINASSSTPSSSNRWEAYCRSQEGFLIAARGALTQARGKPFLITSGRVVRSWWS